MGRNWCGDAAKVIPDRFGKNYFFTENRDFGPPTDPNFVSSILCPPWLCPRFCEFFPDLGPDFGLRPDFFREKSEKIRDFANRRKKTCCLPLAASRIVCARSRGSIRPPLMRICKSWFFRNPHFLGPGTVPRTSAHTLYPAPAHTLYPTHTHTHTEC